MLGRRNTRHLAVVLLCAAELCVTAKYRDAFTCCWPNDDRAVSTTAELCAVEDIPADFGETVSRWSFASVTNLTGNVANLEERFAREWPDLDGEVIRVATNTVGAIQVGLTKARGYVTIPQIPDDAKYIIIRACVRRDENGRYMVVECIGDTIVSNKTAITEAMQDYAIELGDAKVVRLSPSAQASPLQVADIRLVSDYSPPRRQTNLVSRTKVGRPCRKTFRYLTPGDYIWRLESYLSDGSCIASPFSAVTLSPSDPPYPTVFTISLR